MKKLIKEGEEKKKLAKLITGGFVDKMGIEGQGKKKEEEQFKTSTIPTSHSPPSSAPSLTNAIAR